MRPLQSIWNASFERQSQMRWVKLYLWSCRNYQHIGEHLGYVCLCVCTFTRNCKTTNLIAQKPNKTQHDGNCVPLPLALSVCLSVCLLDWLLGWLAGLLSAWDVGVRGSIVVLKWCQHNNKKGNSNNYNKCKAALNMKSEKNVAKRCKTIHGGTYTNCSWCADYYSWECRA